MPPVDLGRLFRSQSANEKQSLLESWLGVDDLLIRAENDKFGGPGDERACLAGKSLEKFVELLE
ncbi:hypothetical protein DMB66_52555 [Actinoplanes sp. ATCC 53533]|nr:hypothetical protein DMB66_52555 [Actinoplanes sp. ATCC 53533]